MNEEDKFAENAKVLGEAIEYGITDLHEKGYGTINPFLVKLALTAISQFNTHYLIQGFIEASHKECWDCIKSKDEEYFVKNSAEIFKYLPTEKVDLFKELFTTKDKDGVSVISQSLKDDIWEILHAMVKISIQYIHKNRVPIIKDEDGIQKMVYTCEFFDEIAISEHAKKWKVTLETS